MVIKIPDMPGRRREVGGVYGGETAVSGTVQRGEDEACRGGCRVTGGVDGCV